MQLIMQTHTLDPYPVPGTGPGTGIEQESKQEMIILAVRGNKQA